MCSSKARVTSSHKSGNPPGNPNGGLPGEIPTDKIVVVVAHAEAGVRLDRFLTERAPVDLSRAKFQTLVRQQHVKVNGRAVPSKQHLNAGDRIEITLPPQQPPRLQATPLDLQVLYEDKHLLAINKPPHLSVHPGAGARTTTLVEGVLHHCSDLSTVGGPLRPGIVHRLDKETSGVLLVAKNDHAHEVLARQFAERQVRKTYEALVAGKTTQQVGCVQGAIARHPYHRKKMALVDPKPTQRSGRGKSAETAWSLVRSFNHFSHLRLSPKTGRTHQIRVHLESIGHPIIGDKVYGTKTWRAAVARVDPAVGAAVDHMHRHALHAAAIIFHHPVSQAPLEVVAPPPDDWYIVLQALALYDGQDADGRQGA